MKIATVESVLTEDERSAIEDACRHLVYFAAQHVDFGRADEFADLFAADGRLTIAGSTSEGRDAIRARIAARPAEQVSRHVCANVIVDVQSPDDATGTSYVCLFRGCRTAPGSALPTEMPLLIGHFVDRFIRTPDGWRIADRTLNSDFRRPDV